MSQYVNINDRIHHETLPGDDGRYEQDCVFFSMINLIRHELRLETDDFVWTTMRHHPPTELLVWMMRREGSITLITNHARRAREGTAGRDIGEVWDFHRP
jgi:hypothetical protein